MAQGSFELQKALGVNWLFTFTFAEQTLRENKEKQEWMEAEGQKMSVRFAYLPRTVTQTEIFYDGKTNKTKKYT